MKKEHNALVALLFISLLLLCFYFTDLSKVDRPDGYTSFETEKEENLIIFHKTENGGELNVSKNHIVADKITISSKDAASISYVINPASQKNSKITRVEASFYEKEAYDRIQKIHSEKLEEIKISYGDSTWSDMRLIEKAELERDKNLSQIEYQIHDQKIFDHSKEVNITVTGFPKKEGYVVVKTHISAEGT